MTGDEAADAIMGYRSRFRFRVAKKLNIADTNITVEVAAKSVTISTGVSDKPI